MVVDAIWRVGLVLLENFLAALKACCGGNVRALLEVLVRKRSGGVLTGRPFSNPVNMFISQHSLDIYQESDKSFLLALPYVIPSDNLK